MKDLYNNKYLFDVLYLLNSELEDLSAWSVCNSDYMLDEIAKLKQSFDRLRVTIFEFKKQQLQDELSDHDCHLSEEDSCDACERLYKSIKEITKK